MSDGTLTTIFHIKNKEKNTNYSSFGLIKKCKEKKCTMNSNIKLQTHSIIRRDLVVV